MDTCILLLHINNYMMVPPSSVGDFPAASVIVAPVQGNDCKINSILWHLTIKGWFCAHKILLLDLEFT